MHFGKRRGDFRRLALGFGVYLLVLLTYTAVISAEEGEVGEPQSILGWAILVAIICTALLFWVFDVRNVKENGLSTSIVIGYIITLAILIGIGYGYNTYHLSDTETITECDSPENCNMYRHVHTYVDVYTCGSKQPFLFPLQAGGAALQHTHHEQNRVHWHEKLLLDAGTMTIQRDERVKITTGSFFDRMDVPFTQEDGKVCVNGKCDGDTCDDGQAGKWIATVEGQANNEWRDYLWRDEEHIRMDFTTAQTAIAAWQNNAKIIHAEDETFVKFPVTLGVVIGFSAVDSINPCAFGVLIFLITYLLKSGKQKKDLLIHGFIYIFFVFLTYISAGLILLTVITTFQTAFQAFSNFFYYLLATVVIIFGLMELRDYIKEKLHPGEYHAIMAIRPKMKEKIESITYKIVDKKSTSAFLGFFVSLVELPCTGAVYLAILAAMAFEGFTLKNVSFLVLYNIIFVLPLIGIMLLAYKGMSTFEFKRWYINNKGRMRLAIALVLVGMGGWLLESVGFFTLAAQWMNVPGAWQVLIGIIVAAFLITAWQVHHARSRKLEQKVDESHEPHTLAHEHHEQVTAMEEAKKDEEGNPDLEPEALLAATEKRTNEKQGSTEEHTEEAHDDLAAQVSEIMKSHAKKKPAVKKNGIVKRKAARKSATAKKANIRKGTVKKRDAKKKIKKK